MSFPAGATAGVPSEEMTFGKSISTCFAKYFDFKGRASRPEYWYFYLFCFLLGFGTALVDSSQVLPTLTQVALFLPSIAAATRRLHDTNRSGWWLLIALTGIGLIPLVIWWARKGSDQDNQYGSPA
jgi:uncharacterized membrane protein YhaH (DUF805 family)